MKSFIAALIATSALGLRISDIVDSDYSQPESNSLAANLAQTQEMTNDDDYSQPESSSLAANLAQTTQDKEDDFFALVD